MSKRAIHFLNIFPFLIHSLHCVQISIDAAALAKASETVWTLVDRLSTHLEWGSAISIHLPGDRTDHCASIGLHNVT